MNTKVGSQGIVLKILPVNFFFLWYGKTSPKGTFVLREDDRPARNSTYVPTR